MKIMENKQTAVEWLQLQIDNKDMGEIPMWVYELINQAKAMEKQQIIDSFGVGCQVESTRLIGYHKMAEQYYTETYGK
jgi:hypothetical protein